MNFLRLRTLRAAPSVLTGLRPFAVFRRNFSTDPLPTLVYPESNTEAHNDLKSFVNYASRTSLDVSSTVFVGTFYEYTVGETLSRYNMSLRRIGGQSDGGIDLLGVWNNPSGRPGQLRVLVQCKAGAQKTGPRAIRELEGAFASAPEGWKGDNVLGIFVSQAVSTKGLRTALSKSKWPLVVAAIRMTYDSQGRTIQLLWNRAAENVGLAPMGVTILRGGQEDDVLLLTWEGKVIPLRNTTPAH